MPVVLQTGETDLLSQHLSSSNILCFVSSCSLFKTTSYEFPLSFELSKKQERSLHNTVKT